ncbi:MAG: penicillin-binding protein 2 [Candidatus Omnitrophica bacterium]|nr:penicillin-binding protein 2 [Candidatus Omnitrophota bacterium]
MKPTINKLRLSAVPVILIVVLALFWGRLGYLQFFHPRNLGETAKEQARLIREIPPFRGKILDRTREELAVDLRLYSLGVNARAVSDPDGLAERLETILGMEPSYLRDRLSRDKSFVWVARQLEEQQSEALRALNDPALELRSEWKRLYPNQDLAAHVMGFTGLDHYGLEGVELKYDSYLKGIPGWKATQKDAKQREVVARQSDFVLPVNGYDVTLSLDIVLQHLGEKALNAACEKHHAQSGSLVVMRASTGDVLVMANMPGFDPNAPGDADPEARRTRALTDMYEPGSVFKIFTVSGALNEKLVAPEEKIDCENGTYRTGGRVLHDVHGYGMLPVKDIVAKSSNIGTSKIAERLGKEGLYDYLKKFGFGEATGIDLPGEIPGVLRRPKDWSAPSLSCIAMGQEVGLTAIRLASAVGAIANGGILMKPRIVMDIREYGQIVKSFPVTPRRRVISPKTAEVMRAMMTLVVREGTGKRADIPGAVVGGKTGTAQKIGPDGAYSHDHFFASFGGFVEKEGEMFTILVSIDDPHPYYYGGTVAAPVFREMAEAILDYWE